MVKLRFKTGSKGQIVITKEIREKFRIKPGKTLLKKSVVEIGEPKEVLRRYEELNDGKK